VLVPRGGRGREAERRLVLVRLLPRRRGGLCWDLSRARLRALHGIPGSLAADVCATALCPCCYLAQALNQLDAADGISAAVPRMPDVARGRFGKQAVSSAAGAAKAAGVGEGVSVGATPLAARLAAAPAGATV